jgi:hypothetical protein
MLRWWWNEILDTDGRYPCYAVLLGLPSDKHAINYLLRYGQELEIISGEYCLILALSQFGRKDLGLDDSFEALIGFSKSSVEVSKLFKIPITDFPCLLFFNDIRSPEHIVITLKAMTTKEIAEKMRAIFSIIQAAVTTQKKPLTAIDRERTRETLLNQGKTIVGEIRKITGKALEAAVDAWIKALIG